MLETDGARNTETEDTPEGDKADQAVTPNGPVSKC